MDKVKIEKSINQEFVNDLYEPSSSGIKILKGEISNEKLKEINNFIKKILILSKKRERNIFKIISLFLYFIVVHLILLK